MIEIEDLVIETNGKEVISGISTTIDNGLMTLLVSPSELEMRALLHALCGMWPTKSGHILVDGNSVHSHSARQRTVCVFERSFMNPSFTPRENLRYYLDLRGIEQVAIRRDLEVCAKRFLLHESLDAVTRNLGAGVARGLETIEAFVAIPKYFVLCDLTSAFLEHYLRALPGELRRLTHEGTGVISSTPSLELAQLLSKLVPLRVVLLMEGQIAATGSLTDIMGSLSHVEETQLEPKFGKPKHVEVSRAIKAITQTKQSNESID